MVDFTTAGVGAALGLAQRLLYRWITTGKVRVKTSEVDSAIATAARDEADRLRIRVDDLERLTKELLEQLVLQTPQISYERPRLRSSELVFDYNPRDGQSSKALLQQLDERVKLLTREAGDSGHQTLSPGDGWPEREPRPPDSDGKDQAEFMLVDPPPRPRNESGRSTSAQMLEDLRRRIQERENPRS